jgi:hypothetical protein
VLGRYAQEHKEPLATGKLPEHCEVVGGEFWTGDIARHDRRRLAYAVWTVLSRRLMAEARRLADAGRQGPSRTPRIAYFLIRSATV